MKPLNAFPPAMLAACEAAIAAKIFYESAFQKFVVDKMGGYGCEAVLMREARIDEGVPPSAVNARLEALREEVRVAPRGHYLLVQLSYPGRTYFQCIASLGDGELAAGCSFDTYDTRPSTAKVLERTFGHEIYACRKAIESERRRQRDLTVLAEQGWQVGTELKSLVDGSKHYSTARVTGVDYDNGVVALYLIRRGSPKRWTATWGAARIAAALAEGVTEVEVHASINPQQTGGEPDGEFQLL